MKELVKLLDINFEYQSHEIKDEKIFIKVKPVNVEATCPYCGTISKKIHSRIQRTPERLADSREENKYCA